ncbi:cobalt chelatase [Gammaproteobacteria bacterium]|nr:cobalt chelatase [Gammaproteobacteria bacterium]MDC0367209.1 cobalt chelatase [Gammaproteobacteria bacterium]
MNWKKRREMLHEAGISSLKAISNNKEIETKIGSPSRPPQFNEAKISPVPRSSKKLNAWRAESDFQAFWHTFHKELIKPNINSFAKDIISELEISRVEILGSAQFYGSKKNITEYYNVIADELYDIHENPPMVFNLWLKQASNHPLNQKSKKLISELEKEYAKDRLDEYKQGLLKSLDNQDSFTSLAIKLLESLDLIKVESVSEDSEEMVDDVSQSNETTHEDNAENRSDDSGDDINSEEILEVEMGIDELQQEVTISSSESSIDEEIELSNINNIDLIGASEKNYKVFTNKFDEVIEARDLISPEEAIRLRSQLDNLIKPHLTTIGKLANRLQRLLLSQQNTSWNFDLEEGTLDTSRLHRVVAEPGYPLSYKQESENKFKDTVITLLIDNSGSMRGRSISLAAICGDIISSTFERCAVKTEVLGFTTKNWKGGSSKQEWVDKGQPANPGRLNDLRHIVYKSADNSWRRARKYFGAMLREGLLKENIDGEALLWSYSRLMKRQEQRKIIIVISDGAPVDDSTLSANSENYLDGHLKDSIEYIESSKNIELQAIGIGHDVNKYYKDAITIHRAEELGEVLLEKLTKLFKTS